MPSPRVVVTGMGAVSAAGIGVEPLWRATRSGRSCVGQPRFARPGRNRVNLAAQLQDFRPEDHFEPKLLPYYDRYTQFAVLAADEALIQSGLTAEGRLGPRAAVILGTGGGGLLTIEEFYSTGPVDGARLDPWSIPRGMGSAAASQIGMRHGCTGPTFGVSSACSSGAQAIGLGLQLIRSGLIDRAVVGGSDAAITALNIRGWELLRVLTPDFSRPFSIGRNGMVIGEGAAVFVLETDRAARERGAEPLVELAGYGTTSDALDIVRPDVNGTSEAMRLAIADARLDPADIDYVNAHGTGTIANDIAEAESLLRIFGDRLRGVAVSSTKPVHGHTMGAAGAVELAVTVMALRDGVAPPTINWLGRDPKITLDPVPNEARSTPIRAALSNSFAFGGINACLVVTAAR
jgi:nodulation protein E